MGLRREGGRPGADLAQSGFSVGRVHRRMCRWEDETVCVLYRQREIGR